MKTFVMGDIHGAHKAMLQCFERSAFDYDNDRLIFLGDVADGYDRVYECVNELLKIKNLIAIRGNHDQWFEEFIVTGTHPDHWMQGGKGTYQSYMRNAQENGSGLPTLTNIDIPLSHQNFFKSQKNYFIDPVDGRLYVHGGFNRHMLLKDHPYPYIFYWDRDLFNQALSHHELDGEFKIVQPCTEVFIGHTATTYWKQTTPMCGGKRVWNLDTGAGWRGPLTIMDVETKQYWQSAPTGDLYPGQRGR